jgi:chromosome segregation ATPase
MRRTRILWVIAILLVGSVAALAWFGTPILKEHKALLGTIPGFQTALDAVTSRANSAESRLNILFDDRAMLAERMANIEKSAVANLRLARNQAGALVAGMKNEIVQNIQAIQARLAGVESTQRETHDEIARLQNELAGVRGEVIGLREENARQAAQVQEMQQVQQSTQNAVTGLDRRLGANQTRVDTLSYQVDRQRVDFNLPKGKTEEVAENIFLTVKETDVKGQRVNGWLQIAKDGRIIWLRGEGAQHPVAFSSAEDERLYQLVFTRVNKTGVSGYVLVPNSRAETPIAEK